MIKMNQISAKLSKVQAIATDVDGTITGEDRKIDCAALKKIRELEEAGLPVILITGHVFPVVSGLANYIGTSGPVVAEGGCIVGFPWDIKFKLGESFPRKVIKIMKGLGFSEAASNSYRHRDLGFHRNGVLLGTEEIKNRLKEYGISVEVQDSGYAIHVGPPKVDKGTGLLKALELLGKDVEHTAVIGDSTFDGPMYKTAGFSAAPINAPQSLKEISTVVLESVLPKAFVEFANLILTSMS